MYILEVAMDNLAKGTEIQIDGLGIFKNGSSYEISADAAKEYQSRNAVPSFEHTADGTVVTEMVAGSTILQDFKHVQGITVRRMSSKELEAFKKQTEPEPEEEAPVVSEGQQGPVSAEETTGGES